MLRILQRFAVSVRLSGSGLSNEGRLEVYYHGVWGTVCDRLFDDTDAKVACNALGFGYVAEFISGEAGKGGAGRQEAQAPNQEVGAPCTLGL